jgi:hypothetical protein
MIEAILALAIAVALLVGPLGVPVVVGLDSAIDNTALEYVDDTLEKTVRLFATASAVKATIAVVEGSEVGLNIGASGTIQLGDMVQPAYDYVDLAWRTLFLSMATLFGIKLLLELSVMAAPWLIALTLVLGAVALLVTRVNRTRLILRDAFRVSVLVTLGAIIVLPVAVWSGGMVSRSITEPHIAAAETTIVQLESSVGTLDAQGRGFFGEVRRAKEFLASARDAIAAAASELALATVRLIVGYVFDCLLFPLGLFFLGMRAVRGLTSYLMTEDRLDRVVDAIRETG